MRLLVPFLLSCSLTLGAVEEGERERLREELPNALMELTDTQARLVETLGNGGIAIPPGLQVTVSARRTEVDDWLKKIGNPAVDFSPEEADQVRDALYGLRGRMEQVNGLADVSGSLDDRWPHAKDAPELQRYRAFLRSEIDRALVEMVAGADVGGDEGVLWQRQRRHEIILQTIESTSQMGERWAQVPKDSQVLREYLEHAVKLRATAERGLQQTTPGDDRDLDRDEAILWLLDEIVQLAQTRVERLADRQNNLPNQLVAAFANGLVAEEKSLRALIAHRRATITDESAWQHAEEDLRRERDRCARLTGLAWEGFEIDQSIDEQRRHLDEVMKDSPASSVESVKPRLAELDQNRTANATALAKAVADCARIDAVTAKNHLRIVQRNLQALSEILDQGREREASEQEWRDHAANPTVAAALAKLDAAWKVMDAARVRQVESDVAAIKADHARELAEIASEEAQISAEQNQRELQQAQEQIELRRQEVRDAVENPTPKPEGDTKF